MTKIQNENAAAALTQVSPNEYAPSAIFSLDDTMTGNSVSAFRFGDANGDGITDAIVVPFDGSVRMLSLGDENRIEQTIVGNMDVSAVIDDAAISDLDLDGVQDLVYAVRGYQTVETSADHVR